MNTASHAARTLNTTGPSSRDARGAIARPDRARPVRARAPQRRAGKQGAARGVPARTPRAVCKSRIAGGVIAAALATSALGFAPVALAAGGSTDVMLVASEDQLSVTVPSSLPVAVKADGTFVVPDLEISNHSVFDVHVSGIKATPAEGFSIVDQNALGSAQASDSLWMAFTSPAGETVDLGSSLTFEHATEAGKWTIERRTGDASGVLVISGAGAVNELASADASGREALNVAFTIKPGR